MLAVDSNVEELATGVWTSTLDDILISSTPAVGLADSTALT
jgi:hypothetical protein